MSTESDLGPLVRRWGIPISQLPAASATAEELKPFILSILKEAVPFIDGVAPKTSSPTAKLWSSKGFKSSPDTTAKVETRARELSASELQAVASKHGVKAKVDSELWVARLSFHEDAAKKGTASWAEFDHGFRLSHGKTEMAFTPDVIGANEAQKWSTSGLEVDEAASSWDRITLVVEEMRHKIGRPVLKDRTFPVLQLTAAVKKEGPTPDEFIIVSIPVPDFANSEHANLSKEKGAQIAYYASIERIRKLEDGRIEWLLATASDAAGVLPLWIQDKALEGIVWKDVPLYLGYMAREGRKSGEKAVAATPAPVAEPVAAPALATGKEETTETQNVPTEAAKAPEVVGTEETTKPAGTSE